MIKRSTTPGPPLNTASPRELKLPAPMIAAIPKKVRSRTVRTLLKPCECASVSPLAESERIDEIFFLRNNEFDISCWFGHQDNENQTGDKNQLFR